MADGRDSETLFVVVDYIGDRFVEYGLEATVSDLVGALRGSASLAVGSIQVQRTGQLLSPKIPLAAADIRSGDRLRIVQADRIAQLADADLGLSPSATLQMLSGPLVGSLYGISAGPSTIGRVSSNDVVIVDPGISRHHAVITVDESSVSIVDNQSTNGIRIDGEIISGSAEVPSGQQLMLGQSWVSVVHHPPVDPAVSSSDLLFEPPDRTLHRYEGQTITLPESPPAPGKRRRTELRGAGRNQHKQAIEQFDAAVAAADKQLQELAGYELASRLYEAPSIHEVLFGAVSNWRRWERRVAESDGLEVRLGLGQMVSRTTTEIPPVDGVPVADSLVALQERYRRIDAVPAVVDFRKLGSVGLTGESESVDGLAYSIVAQLAWFHPPDELGVACRPAGRPEAWDWLKWLPHVDFGGSHNGVADADFVDWLSALLDDPPEPPNTDTGPGADTGADTGSGSAVGSDRAATGSGSGSRPPAILVVVDNRGATNRADEGGDDSDAAVDNPGVLPPDLLARLVQEGPALGVYSVLIGGQPAELGASIGARVTLGARTAKVEGAVDEGTGEFAVEQVDLETVTGLARRLTPVRRFPETGSKRPISNDVVGNGLMVGPFQLGVARPLETAAVSAMTIPASPRHPLKPMQPRDLNILPHGDDDGRLLLGTVRSDDHSDSAVFAYNLARDGTLGLTGDRGTGKTTALRSVAAAAVMLRLEPNRLPKIYYLDVRGGLEGIGGLPHVVGAAKNDIDGFRSVVTDLERLLVDRAASFSQAGVDTFEEYRTLAPDHLLRRALVLIDEIDAFVELMDALQPTRAEVLLDQLADHGARLGVHLVFSVRSRNDVGSSLAGRVGRWLELGKIQQGRPLSPGVALVGRNEVQFATVGGGRDRYQAMEELAGRLSDRGVNPVAG